MKKHRVLSSVLVVLLVLALAFVFIMLFSKATVKELPDGENTAVPENKRAVPDYSSGKRTIPVENPPGTEYFNVDAVDDENDPIMRGTSADRSAELACLANEINGMNASGDHGMDYIPPKVRDLAGQIKDMVDSFDDATLDAAKAGLNAIPGVHAEPSEAKLRMSDDGITLKVTIPTENLKIGPRK